MDRQYIDKVTEFRSLALSRLLRVGIMATVLPPSCSGSVGKLDLASSGLFSAWLSRRGGSCIDDKADIACFSSLGSARDRLCQAKERPLSHPTTESSDRA